MNEIEAIGDVAQGGLTARAVEPPAEPAPRFSLGPPGSDRRRILFFALTGAFAIAILVVFRDVLAPFALALVIA